MGRVVERLGERLADLPGAAEGAVDPRVVGHLDHGGDPAPLLAHEPGVRVVELDLARRVGLVPELVLQALEVEPVHGAVRREAREQEARETARSLGRDQEGVGHGDREEPLVPHDAVLGARASRARRERARRVGAQIGAALLLGHAHADDRARLLLRGQEARIVGSREEPRRPLGRDVGLHAESRHRRVADGGRTADPRFDLRQHEEGRPARDVRARPGLRPGARVDPVRDAEPEDLVPGGVILDVVATRSEAVVRVEDREVPVGLEAPLDHLGAPEPRAEPRQVLGGPAASLSFDSLRERAVRGEDVVVAERRRLVRDLVGLVVDERRVEVHGVLRGQGLETRSSHGRRGLGIASSRAREMPGAPRPVLDF